MRTPVVSVGILALLLLAFIAYHKLIFEPQLIRYVIERAPRPAVTVSAAMAEGGMWWPRISAIGTTRAAQGVEVAAQVDGIITAIEFNSGDSVKAGERLVRIDDTVEQAELRSNLAALTSAQLAYERQKELFLRGTASKAAFDEAKARYEELTAAVERIRAIIERKSLEAPFAGRLGIRRVDVGQYVVPGQAIVSLQKLDPIYVDFSIPEHQAGIIRAGQTVELRIDVHPGHIFTGKVESVDARIAQETRTLLVRAAMPNPERSVLPGMFADIAVISGEPNGAVTVPRTAVTHRLNRDVVYVLTAVGTIKKHDPATSIPGDPKPELYEVEMRPVTVGEARDDRVRIIGGIEPGEIVATSGQHKLRAGMRVRVDNSNPLSPVFARLKE